MALIRESYSSPQSFHGLYWHPNRFNGGPKHDDACWQTHWVTFGAKRVKDPGHVSAVNASSPVMWLRIRPWIILQDVARSRPKPTVAFDLLWQPYAGASYQSRHSVQEKKEINWIRPPWLYSTLSELNSLLRLWTDSVIWVVCVDEVGVYEASLFFFLFVFFVFSVISTKTFELEKRTINWENKPGDRSNIDKHVCIYTYVQHFLCQTSRSLSMLCGQTCPSYSTWEANRGKMWPLGIHSGEINNK